jgi:hypothetical protein
MNTIDYRKSSEGLVAAWFAYRAANPGSTLSAASFAAGWNAAKANTTS